MDLLGEQLHGVPPGIGVLAVVEQKNRSRVPEGPPDLLVDVVELPRTSVVGRAHRQLAWRSLPASRPTGTLGVSCVQGLGEGEGTRSGTGSYSVIHATHHAAPTEEGRIGLPASGVPAQHSADHRQVRALGGVRHSGDSPCIDRPPSGLGPT